MSNGVVRKQKGADEAKAVWRTSVSPASVLTFSMPRSRRSTAMSSFFICVSSHVPISSTWKGGGIGSGIGRVRGS